jgi:hypothetical protein
MEVFGSNGFFLFIGLLYVGLAAYAGYRMTKRAAPAKSQGTAAVSPNATSLAVGAVLEKGAADPRPAGG